MAAQDDGGTRGKGRQEPGDRPGLLGDLPVHEESVTLTHAEPDHQLGVGFQQAGQGQPQTAEH